MKKQNLSIAEVKLTKSEIAAAERVLRSGALRQGKECDFFEQEFSEEVGAQYSVACASGSAALHLAYMSLLEPGDEVLVPSFTFISTASMVNFANGIPIFCDIDLKTYLIDLKDAKKHVTSRTRAIAPVHLFGNVCDVDAVKKFAKKFDLFVIWDAAQAHGALYKEKNVGSFGDIVCYSFYPSKNMFVGEGGMICTDNPEIEQKLRCLRNHGQTGKYLHTMLGFNYRMTDVEAAIGRCQLKRLDEMLSVRRRNADLLKRGLANIFGLLPQEITLNSKHAWHQFCVFVDTENFGCDRNTLADRLKAKGIETSIYYPRGLHQQPIFKNLYGKSILANTELLAENILALPVHHGLSVHDLDRILAALEDCRWQP